MRFTTLSAITNAFIFSAVALIPKANADNNGNVLDFASPAGLSNAPPVYESQNYHVIWYVPKGGADPL
jgi:hypothetical protein